MAKLNVTRYCHSVMRSLVGLALLSPFVAAQSVKVEGIIKARDGDTMILKTSSPPDITVLLTDNTQVGQVQGVFQVRRRECRWRRSFRASM